MVTDVEEREIEAHTPTEAEFDREPNVIEMEPEVRQQFEALPEPEQDENRALLYRYVKYKARLADERTRLKANYEAALKRLGNEDTALDFCYRQVALAVTRALIAGGKAKSVITPHGVAGFRKTAARLEVVDEKKAIPAIRKGSFDLVSTVTNVCTSIDIRGLNTLFKSGGWVPDGCEIVPEEDKFYVK